MIINAVLIDWLTLVTWDRPVAEFWYALQKGLMDEWREQKQMQYVGGISGGVFIGQAEQKQRDHWMLRVSGERAHALSFDLSAKLSGCTRIDLQITVPMLEAYSARGLADNLRAKMREPMPTNIELYENTDELDTVGVFARSSEHYVRIYVKVDADGQRFLRYEAEFKGKRAFAIWRQVCSGSNLAPFLVDSVSKLPKDGAGIIQALHNALREAKAGLRVSYPAKEPNKTLEWLRRAVAPALTRLLNDHDTAFEAWSIMWEVLKNANPAYFNQDT